MSKQSDIHDAFRWVSLVYDEAGAMFADLTDVAAKVGYQEWNVWSTCIVSKLGLKQLPAVQLAGAFYSPRGETEAEAGTAIFFAIDFHSGLRVGPYLLVGTLRHTTTEKVKVEALNFAVRCRAEVGGYFVKAPSPNAAIHIYRRAPGSKHNAGIEEIRAVEIPLTSVASREQLERLLQAAIALRDGDDTQLVGLTSEKA